MSIILMAPCREYKIWGAEVLKVDRRDDLLLF